MHPSARLRLLGLLVVCLAVVGLQVRFGLCTQDDAFISFRYAQNLLEGHGLVFNAGERVEGYTNFLWTVLFVPVLALGLPPDVVAQSLGMLLTVVLLVLAWWASDRNPLAPLLVACFPGLALEAVQGLETVLMAVWVTLAAVGAVGRIEPEKPWTNGLHRWWAVLAGLATLTRPEGLMVFGLLWLMRRSMKDIGLYALVVAPHVLFRLAYYGKPLPNTFYAKVGGFAVPRGLAYLADVAWMALPVALSLVVGLVLVFRRRWVADRLFVSALLCVAYFAYVVAVGGDFKGTGRFVIPVLVLAVLVALRAVQDRPWLACALGVAAFSWSVPGHVKMIFFADRFAGELVQRRAVGEMLGRVVAPSDWIAVHAAGVVPFYAQRPTLDMWGLNDAHIAQAPVEGLGTGTAGHERHDYEYVLQRAPLLILPEQGLVTDAPLALSDPEEFGPGFAERYSPVSLRLDDPAFPGRFLNLWRRVDR